MGVDGTRPIRELTGSEIKEILGKKEINVSPHAFDRLSEMQRKVFIEEELARTVRQEEPRKIYFQENGRYALYFRKNYGFLKIVIECEPLENTIVSFINTAELPKIRL